LRARWPAYVGVVDIAAAMSLASVATDDNV
jgi:hypothetical protein